MTLTMHDIARLIRMAEHQEELARHCLLVAPECQRESTRAKYRAAAKNHQENAKILRKVAS